MNFLSYLPTEELLSCFKSERQEIKIRLTSISTTTENCFKLRDFQITFSQTTIY